MTATPNRDNPLRLLSCPVCDYDLRGQVAPHCPECGFEYEADAVAVYGWLPGRQPGPARLIAIGLLLLLLFLGVWPFTGRWFQCADLIGFAVIAAVLVMFVRLVRNYVRQLNDRTEVCAILGPRGFIKVVAGREPQRYAWRHDHRLKVDLSSRFWSRLAIIEERPGPQEDIVRLDLMIDGSRREFNEVERTVTAFIKARQEAWELRAE